MNDPNFKVIPDCIVAAVVDTFQVQLSSRADLAQMSFSPEPRWLDAASCLSSLPMESGDITGTLALGMADVTLLNIIEKMTGEKHAQLSPEISDAAGEILNIVYASARREINSRGGFNFSPSLPSTVTGSKLRLAGSDAKDKMLFFYCGSDLGDFYVAFSIRLKKTKAA